MAERRQTKSEPKSEPTVDTQEVLRPFHEAALRFIQANEAARQSAARESAEAWLDIQREIHSLEHARFEAITAAHSKALAAAGTAWAGAPEEVFAALAKVNRDLGNEVQQALSEIEPKLAEVALAASGKRSAEIVDRYVHQWQAAYQAYAGEVQRAWSGVKDQDPQTMSAIAQHVLSTLATVYG